jgi:hypothetical protein
MINEIGDVGGWVDGVPLSPVKFSLGFVLGAFFNI